MSKQVWPVLCRYPPTGQPRSTTDTAEPARVPKAIADQVRDTSAVVSA